VIKTKVLHKSRSFVGQKTKNSFAAANTPNSKNISNIGTGILNAQK
jgi:hypothetical protein